MADLAFLALIVAFFALALQLVRGCERIVGSDDHAAPMAHRSPASDQKLAA